MKQLILTGWGYMDYSVSAALALKANSDADIEGVSRRKLLLRLAEIAQSKERIYQEIIILGVGWQGEPDEVAAVLKKLKIKKIAVKWLSVMPLPEWMEDVAQGVLEVCVDDSHESLHGYVSEYFDVQDDELCALDVTDLKRAKLSEKQKGWYRLIQAAQHSHRNYGAVEDYPEAVRTLADGRPLSSAQRALIAHYERYGHRELTGKSPGIERIRTVIERVARKDTARVMIYGESGTGKETVAIHLHHKSSRSGEPFVAFNCASSSTNLLESQLFGYKKGAFTGADKDKKGVFEKADGGTLFLDEVGELSLEIQANLLRVLQEGRFTPLGSHDEVKVDVRVISATNRNLPRMMKEGAFREDLFYRLNVVPISIPPLRDRMDDVKLIADNQWFSMQRDHLTLQQLDTLKQHDWPGNIRELTNFLEYAAVMEELDFTKLLAEQRLFLEPMQTGKNMLDNLDQVTRMHAARVFEKYERNLTHTAEALGITRNTLKKYLNERT